MALVEKTNKPLKKAAGKGAAAPAPIVDDDDDVFAAKENAAAALPKKSPKKKTVEETYQKLTQLEHVLLRPDTYIGSTEMNRTKLWVHDVDVGLNQRDVTYVPGPPRARARRPALAAAPPPAAARRTPPACAHVPCRPPGTCAVPPTRDAPSARAGLYKIFDEILVNAADNKQRDKVSRLPVRRACASLPRLPPRAPRKISHTTCCPSHASRLRLCCSFAPSLAPVPLAAPLLGATLLLAAVSPCAVQCAPRVSPNPKPLQPKPVLLEKCRPQTLRRCFGALETSCALPSLPFILACGAPCARGACLP